MRIATITYIGQEEDIVEDFVRYYTSFVDRMIFMCTVPEDPTVGILQKLKREGLPLELHMHEPEYYDQTSIVTTYLHSVIMTYNPEWILPVDTDEFLRVTSAEFLDTLPQDRVSLMQWQTYVPTAEDAHKPHLLERITHRRDPETPQFEKILIPAALAGEDAVVSAGSHMLMHGINGEAYPSASSNLKLAHFPVRSAEQLKRKALRGWDQMQKYPDRRADEGFHWRRIAERLAAEEDGLTEKRLTEIALRYASSHGEFTLIHDPVAVKGKTPVLV